MNAVAKSIDRYTKGGVMSDHAIQVVSEYGELVLRFVCTAPVGAPCRRRPPEDNWRESWRYTDPDLVDGPCWAEEWVDAGGWESVYATKQGVWASIPVSVSYDDSAMVTLVEPFNLTENGVHDE